MLGCYKCEKMVPWCLCWSWNRRGVVGENDDFVCGACSEDFEPKLIVKSLKLPVKSESREVCTPTVNDGEVVSVKDTTGDDLTKSKDKNDFNTKQIGLWARRVMVWDSRRKVLIKGLKAPTVKGLVAALAKNRHYQVYYGETVEHDDPAPAPVAKKAVKSNEKKTKVAGSDTAEILKTVKRKKLILVNTRWGKSKGNKN